MELLASEQCCVLVPATRLKPASVVCEAEVLSAPSPFICIHLIPSLPIDSSSIKPYVTPQTLVSHVALRPVSCPGLYNNWFSMSIISPHNPTLSCVDENVNGRDTLPLFCCDPTYQPPPLHPRPPASIQRHQ
jgi:hypothetical protein